MKIVALFFFVLGVAYAETDSRVIGGDNCRPAEMPYMVSLRGLDSGNHFCGGTILSRNWVLTSGRCCDIAKRNRAVAFVGSPDLNRGGYRHLIDRIVINPNYRPREVWYNDICLIRVASPFLFDRRVAQVTLPPQSWQAARPGDEAGVLGWGFTKSPGEPFVSDRLQKLAGYTVISNVHCSIRGQTDVTPQHICALPARRGQGICNGDLGGPLLSRGIQVGISSWNFIPCGSGKPDVFTRVAQFIDWIKETLGAESRQLQFSK